MSRVSENEIFLIGLAHTQTKKERVNLLQTASESELLAVFEIILNCTLNSKVLQLISDNKKSKNVLNKLKVFKFPSSKRELKLDRIRKLLIKFNSILPSLLSIVLVSVIGYIKDNCM